MSPYCSGLVPPSLPHLRPATRSPAMPLHSGGSESIFRGFALPQKNQLIVLSQHLQLFTDFSRAAFKHLLHNSLKVKLVQGGSVCPVHFLFEPASQSAFHPPQISADTWPQSTQLLWNTACQIDKHFEDTAVLTLVFQPVSFQKFFLMFHLEASELICLIVLISIDFLGARSRKRMHFTAGVGFVSQKHGQLQQCQG